MAERDEARSLNLEEKERVVDAAQGAARHSDWYADRLQASGFAGSPSFERVPLITETDLAAGYYASGNPSGENPAYVTSGTTTGVGRAVEWSRADDERYVEHRASLFGSLIDDSCRSACADLGTGHAQASAMAIFAALGLEAREIDVHMPIESHVSALAEWRPDLLYTMPVILERIVSAGGPGYVPRWIVVLGDLAPVTWRREMERRLGMETGHIVDVFGSIEVGAIAYSDDDHDRYLFHEHIVPEPFAPPIERVDGAELVVLTSTERDDFPAVRYMAGDIVSGLRPVNVAGHRRWAFDAHLGRHGTLIKHGEALSLTLLMECMSAAAPGATWAVRRSGLEVVIEVDENAYSPAVADTIRRAVRDAHPAVDAMISSGLIGDLGVEPRAFSSGATKRSIR